MIKFLRRAPMVSLFLVVGAIWLGPAQRALAYNGGAAASYADTYWYYYNIQHYPATADDCTNFASQALVAGGFPQQGYPTQNDSAWWFRWVDQATGVYNKTASWDAADHQRTYLLQYAYNPGGYDYGSYAYSKYGNQMYTWANDGLSNGDLVIYSWYSDGTYDHTAIQTSYGYDSTYPSYYGSLVDAHTTDRHHAIWTLRPYNQYWNTTTIDLVHIQ